MNYSWLLRDFFMHFSLPVELGVLKCYSLLRKLSPATRMARPDTEPGPVGFDRFHCDLDVTRLNQPGIAILLDEVHGQGY